MFIKKTSLASGFTWLHQITNKRNFETENKRHKLNQVLTELSSLSYSVRSYIQKAVIQSGERFPLHSDAAHSLPIKQAEIALLGDNKLVGA